MSDEFDREEEKRKLREKYAEDQQDREVTGRMSELLLQGATMTNKHCDRCGSPIFRYQGESFCPTCSAEDEAGDAAADAAADASPSATADADGESGPTPPQVSTEHADGTSDRSAPSSQNAQAQRSQPSQPPQEAAQPAAAPSAEGAAGADVENAQSALAQSITALAQRAANADDPRQAKALLEAAREAADALAALR